MCNSIYLNQLLLTRIFTKKLKGNIFIKPIARQMMHLIGHTYRYDRGFAVKTTFISSCRAYNTQY